MKPWRKEFSSLGLVFVVPLVLALIFPFDAFRFVGSCDYTIPQTAPCAAFVSLTAAEETTALDAAKTAWQVNRSAAQRSLVRLPLGDLPAEARLSPLGRGLHAPTFAPLAPFGYSPRGWRPSEAAAILPPLAPRTVETAPLMFSRKELLAL